ncbi:MAG: helix-hairpin-helix domain-containing protein, partial [Anaerolineae bacterium]|nr:helix-hairpin-helix domain-containing protein [Anaerolineae bacterium]
VAELEELRTFRSTIEAQPDDLTVIKGIGQVYQQKLRNIGIIKLKQLADADPERLKRMLEIKSWQATDVASWVLQAADWVQRIT